MTIPQTTKNQLGSGVVTRTYTQCEVANQILHSIFAPTREDDEPHFRSEIRAKAKARVAKISE